MFDTQSLVCSAVRGMLGNISENVRAVLVGTVNNTIYLRYITFSQPTSIDVENLRIAGTEILADFPQMDIQETIQRDSQKLPDELIDGQHQFMIFRRHETIN